MLIEDLDARLSPLVTEGRTVLFHGYVRVAYGSVMQVWAVLQLLRADIGLVTEPIPEGR